MLLGDRVRRGLSCWSVVGCGSVCEFRSSAVRFMNRFRTLAWAVALLAAGVAWVALSEAGYYRSREPRGVLNMVDYVRRFGEPVRVHRVLREGALYRRFTGKGPPYWSLAAPSSLPAYIFDEQGRFVTWCLDRSNRAGFNQEWPQGEEDADFRNIR